MRPNTAESVLAWFETGPDCWVWKGHKNLYGYGMVRFDKRPQPAHRVVYQILVGPIPEGMTLDHLCRNRACVNPDHLEPVTVKVNVLRGIGLSAINAQKTHCPRGYPYDRVQPNGARYCLTCKRDATRVYRARIDTEPTGPAQTDDDGEQDPT